MVSLSFQPNGGLLGATVLIPTHPTVQNYVQAWTENSFSRYFMNSLIVADRDCRHHRDLRLTCRLRLRAIQVPDEGADLLRLPCQPRRAQPFAPDPSVPPHGPAPPPRLAVRARSSSTSRRTCPSRSFSYGASSRRFPRSTRSRSAWTARERCGCWSSLIVPLAAARTGCRIDVHLQCLVG